MLIGLVCALAGLSAGFLIGYAFRRDRAEPLGTGLAVVALLLCSVTTVVLLTELNKFVADTFEGTGAPAQVDYSRGQASTRAASWGYAVGMMAIPSLLGGVGFAIGGPVGAVVAASLLGSLVASGEQNMDLESYEFVTKQIVPEADRNKIVIFGKPMGSVEAGQKIRAIPGSGGRPRYFPRKSSAVVAASLAGWGVFLMLRASTKKVEAVRKYQLVPVATGLVLLFAVFYAQFAMFPLAY